MRIYSNPYELMSETARNIWEMGTEVKPKTYQNKVIEGKDEFITKELICEQYCLTHMDDPSPLFVFTKSKDWADAEFKERISGVMENPGKAWELRKDIWEEFLVNGFFDYTYAERMNETVSYKGKAFSKIEAIIELLKTDNDTRKAILNIYGEDGFNEDCDSNYLGGEHRIPCSMYYDFLIRENAKGEKVLHICYHQRSCDFIGHGGDDIYLAWKLKDHVAEKVGIKSGYLYHTIDSLHSYKKDWWMLKTSLNDIK